MLEASHNMFAIALGHPYVGNDGGGAVLGREVKPLRSIFGNQQANFVLLEPQLNGIGNVRVIVDAQDGGRFGIVSCAG